MPDPSPTRIDYGDSLEAPRIQPSGGFQVDGYGVAQGQQVFIQDSQDSNIETTVAVYTNGVSWGGGPAYLKSHTAKVVYQKGGVAQITVDYFGVAETGAVSKPQITGIATASAQPIETHPNFTVIQDSSIGSTPLAGYPPNNLTTANKPIFVQSTDPYATWQFRGFGLRSDGQVNIKAGIRQYLQPMATLRGQIFLGYSMRAASAAFIQAVGKRVSNADLTKLIEPAELVGAIQSGDQNMVLLTSANCEVIGNPENCCAIKVTYDLMVGGFYGFDTDIYGLADSIL